MAKTAFRVSRARQVIPAKRAKPARMAATAKTAAKGRRASKESPALKAHKESQDLEVRKAIRAVMGETVRQARKARLGLCQTTNGTAQNFDSKSRTASGASTSTCRGLGASTDIAAVASQDLPGLPAPVVAAVHIFLLDGDQ